MPDLHERLQSALEREHQRQRDLCAPNERAELRIDQERERSVLLTVFLRTDRDQQAALETAIDYLIEQERA